MRGLKGRVALVTGAAQGIGARTAHRLAAEGMRVALLDIRREEVALVSRQIADETGEDTLALHGDVSSEADVARIVAECADAFGRLDALINNAGIDLEAAPRNVTRQDWLRLHDVDLWGAFLLVRESEEALARAGGCVVNIASTHAIATMPNRSTYASAKAGVIGLTRGLAIDLGQRGIRVNAVLPGYIRTPIWRLWLDRELDPDDLLSRIAARHPVRRLGTPDDVAGAVAFLCSDDASFITGTTLVVDGGNTSLLESPLE